MTENEKKKPSRTVRKTARRLKEQTQTNKHKKGKKKARLTNPNKQTTNSDTYRQYPTDTCLSASHYSPCKETRQHPARCVSLDTPLTPYLTWPEPLLQASQNHTALSWGPPL